MSPARVPTWEEIAAAAAAYPHGLACIGAKENRCHVVTWETADESMAKCTAKVIGNPVFLSTLTFGDDFMTHVRNHEKPGSMAGYRDSAYGPLLVFDLDRKDEAGRPNPAVAVPDVSSLLVTLLELGLPHECISVAFSGLKGFHVEVPSSLCGAMPSRNFAAIADQFCSEIAAKAGVEIDVNLYRLLQPLRAPNSRHEVSGLFKIPMTVVEFLDRSWTDIELLAARPREFVPPPLMHEPIPAVGKIWSHAEQLAGGTPARSQREDGGVRGGTGGGDARLTWHWRRGAPDGERAVALFRAAANLADFESLDDLIRALLDRATVLCGLPPTEAAAHIHSALRRAAEVRRLDQIDQRSGIRLLAFLRFHQHLPAAGASHSGAREVFLAIFEAEKKAEEKETSTPPKPEGGRPSKPPATKKSGSASAAAAKPAAGETTQEEEISPLTFFGLRPEELWGKSLPESPRKPKR